MIQNSRKFLQKCFFVTICGLSYTKKHIPITDNKKSNFLMIYKKSFPPARQQSTSKKISVFFSFRLSYYTFYKRVQFFSYIPEKSSSLLFHFLGATIVFLFIANFCAHQLKELFDKIKCLH